MQEMLPKAGQRMREKTWTLIPSYPKFHTSLLAEATLEVCWQEGLGNVVLCNRKQSTRREGQAMCSRADSQMTSSPAK